MASEREPVQIEPLSYSFWRDRILGGHAKKQRPTYDARRDVLQLVGLTLSESLIDLTQPNINREDEFIVLNTISTLRGIVDDVVRGQWTSAAEYCQNQAEDSLKVAKLKSERLGEVDNEDEREERGWRHLAMSISPNSTLGR